MYYSVAVYPQKDQADSRSEWKSYMKMAAEKGFNEVFMSLHLPEYTLEEQISLLEELSVEAKKLAMSIMVDIGGWQIKELLEKADYSERVRQAGVEFIRLDYGFSIEQIRQIWEKWKVKGFVINASIFNRAEFMALKEAFYGVDEKIELRACHNYYPRPESGISYECFVQQNEILYELGIPVYSCIPDHAQPRGPLGAGLPTVEAHRYMDVEQVVRQLSASRGNEGLLAADSCFSEEKLVLICETAKKQRAQDSIWTLPICFEEDISEEEKQIVCGQIHHMRYDSNERILRSQSSRQMAEYAVRIVPRSAYFRKRGMVTIDNQEYGRYSGEVQVVMSDLPADEKVNVAGRIVSGELWKLAYYRTGIDYRFEELGTLRKLRSADTKELVELWNRNLPYCQIDEGEWASVVLADENYDPDLCLVIEKAGQIIGYACGVVRKFPYLERGMEAGKGWILALVVDQNYRHYGVGEYLLSCLEERLEQRGCCKISVAAYSPYYFAAGIHETETDAMRLFEKHGYSRGEAAYWMEQDLSEYQMPESIRERKIRLEKEGFSFVPFESAYSGQLLEFLRENFSVGWRVHVMRAMQKKSLEEQCILCLRDGKVAGYVQRGIGGDEYRYGPFGVAPAYRNQGLGSVLAHTMWKSMKERGMKRVYFRSTEMNGRRFYERQGMKVKGIYYHYALLGR